MNELQVQADLTPGVIKFNFEEIRDQVQSIADAYEGATFHEDTVKEAKSSVATLRKIRKAINDRKIEVKKEYNDPYTTFENQVKELFDIIDEPIEHINTQVIEFEEKQKEEKRNRITAFYNGLDEEFRSCCTLESIYNDKWENKTYLTEDIFAEIERVSETVSKDLGVIRSMNSDVEERAIEIYSNGLLLGDAIQYINEDAKRKQEIIEREKERIAREEADRIRAEERAKIQQEKEIEEIKEETKQEAAVEVIESLTPVIDETDKMQSFDYSIKLNADGKKKLEMYMDSVGIEWEVKAWL